jgi:hypothetical protein
LLWLLTDKQEDGPFAEDEIAKQTGCDNLEKLHQYLIVLGKQALATKVADKWELHEDLRTTEKARVRTFGPTFEWLVADKFNRALHWSAAQRVFLADFASNDFDVLAVRGPEVIAVECKIHDSVEEDELAAFAKRHEFLWPTFSILLIDSKKSVRALAKSIEERSDFGSTFSYSLSTSGHLYLLTPKRAPNMYVANTAVKADGILSALQSCLRNHHRSGHIGVVPDSAP